jgi:hypothetical protein
VLQIGVTELKMIIADYSSQIESLAKQTGANQLVRACSERRDLFHIPPVRFSGWPK